MGDPVFEARYEPRDQLSKRFGRLEIEAGQFVPEAVERHRGRDPAGSDPLLRTGERAGEKRRDLVAISGLRKKQ